MKLVTSSGSGATVKLPLVSIIITNKNYERYVTSAIKSAYSQSYENIECIVIDDHSDDDSFGVITDFLASLGDSRFRCIRLGKSLGQMAAFKAGLENSTGLFIASLDADDFWFSSFVEAHLMAHLNTAYSAGLSSSDTMQIDQDGYLLESTFHMHGKIRSQAVAGNYNIVPKESVPNIVDGQAIFARGDVESRLLYVDRSVQSWPFVAMSSFMFRRALIEMIIPDDTDRAKICADYYLAKFCHSLSGSLLIGQAHSAFRIHQENHFSKNRVLGGPHRPGHFVPALAQDLERLIAEHIIKNIDKFEVALGIEFCLKLIGAVYQKNDLVDAVKNSPKLQSKIGKEGNILAKVGMGFLNGLWKRG